MCFLYVNLFDEDVGKVQQQKKKLSNTTYSHSPPQKEKKKRMGGVLGIALFSSLVNVSDVDRNQLYTRCYRVEGKVVWNESKCFQAHSSNVL